MSGTAIPISVEEGYERWAATYDRDPNPLLAREQRHLLPTIAGSHGRHLLDLACGTGRWLGQLCKESGVVGIGLDSSAPMLKVAHEKYEGAMLTQAICEQLPFRDAAFDLGVCSFAVGHMPDLKSTAKELARVLQPGSDLFVTDLHPEAFARGWRVGFRDTNGPLEIEVSPHTDEEIQQSFCEEGFACLSNRSLWLGEPEKPIFERAGRSAYFTRACEIPAVIVFHFKRMASSVTGYTS